MNLLEEARNKLCELAKTQKWNEEEKIHIISVCDPTAAAAIGKPVRDNYPLLKGKEVLIEARFYGEIGQAYTDQPGTFEGTLGEVLMLPLDTNFHRAIFIATLNALMRSINEVESTIHCKGKEPDLCAKQLPIYIQQKFGNPKIAFIGFQPALIEALHNAAFDLKVTDLNPDNIGQVHAGIHIDDGALNAEYARWADVVLATGSVLVNNTYHELQQDKPIIYYGVTAAGLASMFDLPRICFYGR